MLLRYSELTEAQKKHLDDVFFGRPITDAEKKYRYYFNASGVCEYSE